MAKVYGGVEGVECPEYDSKLYESHDEFNTACNKYLEDVIKWCKDNSNCPDAGKSIYFTVGDGKAHYVVLNYRELIHIGTDDGYAIPEAHEKGLRKADIIKEIRSIEKWEEIVKQNSLKEN